MFGLGQPTDTHYFIAWNANDQVRNGSSWETWVDGNYASYAIPANPQGTSGRFIADDPDGLVEYQMKKQVGSSPNKANDRVVWEEVVSTGGASGGGGSGGGGSSGNVTSVSKTIRINHKIGGVLTDYTSAVLSNSAATYGARRTDTGEVIVVAGTTLSHDATGQYSFTFTNLVPDAPYDYWLQTVYAGATRTQQYNFIGPAIPGSAYCSQEDIEDIFGVDNVQAYADKDRDKDPVKISNRIQRAISNACAQVDMTFRGGVYIVPLAASEPTVNGWAASLAGLWLYFSSGIVDVMPGTPAWAVGNQYKKLEKDVYSEMLLAKAGLRELLSPRATSGNPLAASQPVISI